MTRALTAQRHSALGRFFRNPRTGELAVVQMPNLPLSVWIVATLVSLAFSPHGTLGAAVSVVGSVSLGIWAVLEIARGDSPFRRVLGGVVAAGLVLTLVRALLS